VASDGHQQLYTCMMRQMTLHAISTPKNVLCALTVYCVVNPSMAVENLTSL